MADEYISCANSSLSANALLKLLIRTGEGCDEDYIDCLNTSESWLSLFKRLLVTDGTNVYLNVCALNISPDGIIIGDGSVGSWRIIKGGLAPDNLIKQKLTAGGWETVEEDVF